MIRQPPGATDQVVPVRRLGGDAGETNEVAKFLDEARLVFFQIGIDIHNIKPCGLSGRSIFFIQQILEQIVQRIGGRLVGGRRCIG